MLDVGGEDTLILSGKILFRDENWEDRGILTDSGSLSSKESSTDSSSWIIVLNLFLCLGGEGEWDLDLGCGWSCLS